MGDEARSDVALTVAALVLGRLLLGSLGGRSGTLGVLADAVLLLAVTALVPLLLLRSRRLGSHALALDVTGRPNGLGPLRAGVPLALPIAVAGGVAMLTVGAAGGAALLGRLSGSPLQIVPVLALTVGAGVSTVFLAVRGRDAFPRSPVWTLTRLLRTVGMGAAALALVAGLLRVPVGGSSVRAVVNAAALAVLVLIADRGAARGGAVPRLAVMLPAGLAVYLHVTTLGLSLGLVAGALAAGTTAVIATVALGPHGARPLAPLLLALHVWPTCLSPLVMARGLC